MLLVTGATGNIGGELVQQLVALQQPVRALVRSDHGKSLPTDVALAIGDLNQPETLAAALKDVRGVFLLGGYQDMPAVLAELRRADVEHVVLLSSRSVVNGQSSNAIVRMWQVSEDAVRASGVPWTILRPSGFMANALRWLPQMQAGDTIRVPFADVPIAEIDPADIAAVAAVALTSPGHISRSYLLTGPEARLPADDLQVVATLLGKELRLQRLSEDETRHELSSSSPPDVVDAMMRFFANGEFDDSSVLPTVREIAGRSPHTFTEWAQAHIDAFR